MTARSRLLIFVCLAQSLLLVTASAAAGGVPGSAADTRPLTIEYYGDSTVWGYASGTDGQRVSVPAPAVFAKALPNPTRYKVRNEGVSGSTACDLLNGADGKHPAWSDQMAASTATYVIVNHAINDQWKYEVGQYKACLWSLARIATQHGKRIVFETPNPTRDSGSGGLDVYVNAMREVAVLAQAPLIDQYRYLTDYLQGRKYDAICPDGLHPSEEVYRLKGRYAARVFSRIVLAR
jgi:lysophospholipase L1-like esterase